MWCVALFVKSSYWLELNICISRKYQITASPLLEIITPSTSCLFDICLYYFFWGVFTGHIKKFDISQRNFDTIFYYMHAWWWFSLLLLKKVLQNRLFKPCFILFATWYLEIQVIKMVKLPDKTFIAAV